MKIKNKYIKKLDLITLALHFLSIILLVFISIGALRQNNLKMLDLREKVFESDKSGIGVEDALTNLRNFVSSHMNTTLPKLGDQKAIQLKYSYERAVELENKRFLDESNALSQKAKESCLNTKAGIERVNCEQNYIKNNPVKPKKEILPELFSFEFVSPRFSYDLAGFLIILSALSVLLFVARVIALKLASIYIKNNYK